MGSQIPTGSDRSRTNWTPAMESYFIDLLLDQVHRGNRMGHTFNKQAWNEMLAMFNANFGSPYDINVLKSRYTALWTQFNDIKNLLDQSGFSWDEARQMVIASNHVWDAHIKAHPDAQFYRNRVLVNMNDLCLIYAHTSADGRYSLSSHDVDFDDDIQGGNTGFVASNPAPVARERPDKDWTLAMDCYFLKLMLDQLISGNKIHNTFNRKAWKLIHKLFNKKFDAQYDKSFLKNHYKKLKNYYASVKDLLEVKGFHWDEKQQRIVADDDVWDNYIKEHPHVGAYRNKTLLNYQDLGLIFGNASCNEHYSLLQEGLEMQVGKEKEYHPSDGNEYLGGDWTTDMDCYFADLLINQVLDGNKTGHDFTHQAWNEMVTLFNLKFGLHYTKDALKNRYKFLWRQYNDLQVLLKQPGFSWDGKQEMGTAISNSYAKVHPDALSYRDKFVPIYHKLCVIYGQELSEARFNHSACSVDHISDGANLMMENDDIQDPALGACLTTDWTPSMDRYLIDLMLQEVRGGNKIDYALNGQVWIDILILFQERFGAQFDQDFLKNCCKCLEMFYRGMRNLLEQRGFSWDETQQMVIAPDDVWDAYIKEHPDANYYRNKRMPNYNDLCLIYGNSAPQLACNLSGQDAAYDGIGVEFENSHWRSDWTPPMDRYFIDLMLEELHNGSMFDYKFDKLAWRDLMAKFRAEFGSQYDKDVLKSRFKILRKTFNDMKALLDQSGFVWDEMWQIITADKRLWDAYIKEHPDVKMYHKRTLPNFNELFLIYGNTSHGRNRDYSSISRHATDNDLGAGGEEYNQSPVVSDPLRMAWTVNMDRYLIDLLLRQLNRGNKTGDTFSKKAWVLMTASFNKEFELHSDKYALEDRYLGFVRVFKDMTYLFSQNGIAWDDILHSVRANEVWETYFEEHPDAIEYGETVLDNYSELCLIVGNVKQNKRPGCGQKKWKPSNNYFRVETDDITGELQSDNREFRISEKKRKSQAASTSSYARKVQRTLIDRRQQVLEEKKPKMVKTWTRNEEEKDYNSIESIVAALETVPDLDDELFLEACVLLEDQRKANMFVAMDTTARRKWLLKKLYQ